MKIGWQDVLCVVVIALNVLTAGFFWSVGMRWVAPLNGGLIGYMIVQWMNYRDRPSAGGITK